MDNTGAELDRIREILRSRQKGLTIAEIAKLLTLNRISTSKYLNILVASGQAEMRVHGPSKVFYPRQRVPISTILNFSASLLLVMDSDLTIIDVNNALLNFFSLEKKEIIGRRIDYSPITGYVDAITLARIHSALESSGSALETTWEKNGEERFVNLKFIPTLFETGEHGVTLIGEDITELSLYRRHLEHLVDERSEELTLVNKQLRREIEDHKRAREKLRKSEEKLSRIIDFLPDATFVIDTGSNVIAWNRAMEELTGVKAEDILGKGDFLYAYTIYGIKEPMLIDFALIPGHEIPGKYYYYSRDGDKFIAETCTTSQETGVTYLWGTAAPLFDGDGNLVGAIESIRDVTQTKRTEQSLRESEERYFAIIEDQTEMICRCLPDGTFTFVNDAFSTFFSSPTDQVVGTKFRPEEFKIDKTYLSNCLDRLSSTHPVVTIEIPTFLSCGEVHRIRWNVRAIYSPEGKLAEYQSVGRDVTAYIPVGEPEEFHDLLLNQLSEATIAMDLENRITFWNPAAEKLYGWTSSEVLGNDFNRIIAAAISKDEEDKIMAELHEGGRWKGNIVQVDKEGNRLFVNWSLSLINDQNGKSIGKLGVGREIESKELQIDRC